MKRTLNLIECLISQKCYALIWDVFDIPSSRCVWTSSSRPHSRHTRTWIFPDVCCLPKRAYEGSPNYYKIKWNCPTFSTRRAYRNVARVIAVRTFINFPGFGFVNSNVPFQMTRRLCLVIAKRATKFEFQLLMFSRMAEHEEKEETMKHRQANQ